MKRGDIIRLCDQAEQFLRSSLSRNIMPIGMAESWACIHRIRESLNQDTESLPPITALEAKDGPPAQYRHVRKP